VAQRSKRPCNYIGCSALTTERYCDEHRRLTHREYKDRRTDTYEQRFYSSARWRKVRARKLAANPLCEMCIKDGRLTGAQMVDHITPIKRGGAQLDMNNLQSLCNACHNKKTAKE